MRLRPSHSLATAILCLAGATSGRAAPLTVPAINDPPTQERHAGKAIFVELVTPDLAGAERFYGPMFGWSFHDIKTGPVAYAEATLGGQAVAGIVQKPVPPGDRKQPFWISFFSVGDVDAAEKAAVQNGATVLREAHTLPDRGREAVLADPQGAVFALLTSSSGDTPDVLSAQGDWIWRSLLTKDAVAASTFYKAVLGYEVTTLAAAPGEQHLLLSSEQYARGSANTLPEGHSTLHPIWLDYVRVPDAASAAAKAVALGGRVLAAPRIDRQGGMIAVVADPQGAPVGLFEWADADGTELSK